MLPGSPPSLLLVFLLACAPAAHPLIAEVFYDAPGDDTGCEFVEFFNPGDTAAPLAGARLEAGDGSGPGRWSLRWTGNAGDSVPPSGRFVVGGARVQPPPQAIVTLDLQNGPDAVRVVWPDGATEVVGYGTHEFAEYACGSPAPDVASGFSLARVPDGADLGGNALDFRAAPPSPARANLARRNLALVRGSLVLTPGQPEPLAPARLAGLLANPGAEALAAGEGTLVAAALDAAGDRPLFERPWGQALAPGDTVPFDEPVSLSAGRQWLRVAVRLAGDEVTADDADSLLVRAGPGPLEATEIQFHPAAGEGEWVELRNRSPVALDLAGFTLADRGSARGVPAEGSGLLAPESLAVLAQDRAALLQVFPALDPARVWAVRPWSSLNNSDDTSGVADVVTLREADGTPCQRVPYSAAGVPAGVPLELRDGGWWPAQDPTGTPQGPPRPRAALAGWFELGPRRLAAGADARLAWDLPWPRARLTLELYDLAGRRVARPLAALEVPARGERPWLITGLPPGLYVAFVEARPIGSGDPSSRTFALRLAGAR